MVDISDEACSRFGVKHGDKIIDCADHVCVGEGVARKDEGKNPKVKVLWTAREGDNSRVSFCYPLGPDCLRPVPKNALGGEQMLLLRNKCND